ncbi:hypothetical protein [Metallosphaera hakonensis]|uniref:VapB-type antitoxin n=1 Tax=Metallosphaera hakonensis JCM 8857 = DSM 7519 TaxID=1293036 RepID=A0A2U9IR90_9CREN|nr:hypothetical protein [Metallosphaera hakonensis]AWR98561.1 hypothetical protein DFR87_01300 [Metallosphaera hakonensis JCM 8857 = DSM 7519]
METIKVNAETKKRLTKIAGILEKKTGKRVSYDDVINYLIDRREVNKKYARKLFGIAKGLDLYDELIKGRTEDEKGSP